MTRVETFEVGGRQIQLQTGALARRADGAVTLTEGETFILATVVRDASQRELRPFLPLSVEYRERTAAAGRIPGGWGRRELRQAEHEILASRLIDRALRPLIEDRSGAEIQVTVTVFGADPGSDVETLGILAASAAMMVSPIPFSGPVAAIRLARVGDAWSHLPSQSARSASDAEVIVAATRQGVVMFEGGAVPTPDAEVIEGLSAAVSGLAPAFDALERIGEATPVVDICAPPQAALARPAVLARLERSLVDTLEAALIAAPSERAKRLRDLPAQIVVLGSDEAEHEGYSDAEAAIVAEALWRRFVRGRALEGRRMGGRGAGDVRAITCATGLVPSNHGSALFTRGGTQALVSCTIGGSEEALVQEGLFGRRHDRFFLHYNFPAYAVGEARGSRGPGRREIGHGALARRALVGVLPSDEASALRVVSDILESDGSSSMATVCGGTLALIDAGVALVEPVAGIAMGGVHEEGNWAILSDISGAEDHLGDFDLKIAGTASGLTALQLDTKGAPLPLGILSRAFAQAREGLAGILADLGAHLDSPGFTPSRSAPKVARMKIPVKRIGTLIGSGGKTIQGIEADTGSRIEVKDDGSVRIQGPTDEVLDAARARIEDLAVELVEGRVYEAVVVRLKDFGAIVRIGDHEGLVHVSELALGRVERADEVVSVDDRIEVTVLGADDRGRLKLSRRAALSRPFPAEG